MYPERKLRVGIMARSMSVFGKHKEFLIGILVFLAAFILYAATLAPEVVYGDSAVFLMRVHEFSPEIGVNYHPLYCLLGKLLSLVPLGAEAYRVNLVSAIFGAGAVFVFYKIIFLLLSSRVTALITAGALAVSHTLWFHAVVTAAYTFHIFCFTIQIYFLLSWREFRKDCFLYLFLLFFALGFDHLLNVLYIPAYAFLILRTDRRILFRKKQVLYSILSCLAGASYYIIVFFISLSRATFVNVFMEASALSHREHMFSYSLGELLHFTWSYVKYLAYQFPFVGVLLGFFGFFLLRKRRDVFVTLLLIYFVDVIFGVSYNETTDIFSLFLPSYVVFAIWIGCGVHHILSRITTEDSKRRVAYLLLAAGLIGLPVLTYYCAPRLLKQFNRQLAGPRDLPMRDTNSYYLWPPKINCYCALNYGRTVCDIVKPDGLIIADNGNLARLVMYQQKVFNKRDDINVENIKRSNMVKFIEDNIEARPTYIFTLEEEFYPVLELRKSYDLVGCDGDLLFEIVASVASQK